MKPAALADAVSRVKWQQMVPSFSNFEFVEKEFGFDLTKKRTLRDAMVLRRLFSEARRHEAKTVVIEDIAAQGVLRSENLEIKRLFPDYRMTGLRRITFWRRAVKTHAQLAYLKSTHLAGYLIAKKDCVPSKRFERWHVFESVFRKYSHVNNCIPNQPTYPVKMGKRRYAIKGVLYGQQNQLNKACAQVALRSLCSLHVPLNKLTYARINNYARRAQPNLIPHRGLWAKGIQSVLRGFKLEFTPIDYTRFNNKVRKDVPYQKIIYAGVESGSGALLGFQMAPPRTSSYHIIAFFGHTFNQDTWVPKAAEAYFPLGEETKYIPSEQWVSSYVGHDDNFGSNFCVPRLYVNPKNVQYVLALLPRGVKYDALTATAIATDYFYSIKRKRKLDRRGNIWVRRLIVWAKQQEVVFRAIAATKSEYLSHLTKITDWHGNREDKIILDVFRTSLPSHLWLIEISLPELFPINRRKLGEIVLDATKKPESDRDYEAFLLARFPGQYFFIQSVSNNNVPKFLPFPSQFISHTSLFLKKDIAHE